MSLAKGISLFVSAFFTKFANQEKRDRSDWICLDIWALLSFISVDILLAKTIIILVVSFVVRNNSCDNSSSSNFFLFNLNIVPVSFLATENLIGLLCISFLWFFLKLLRQTCSIIIIIIIITIIIISSSFFNSPTNSICWIALGVASNFLSA